MMRTDPTFILVGSTVGLAALSAATLIPYFAAILIMVSPALTL